MSSFFKSGGRLNFSGAHQSHLGDQSLAGLDPMLTKIVPLLNKTAGSGAGAQQYSKIEYTPSSHIGGKGGPRLLASSNSSSSSEEHEEVKEAFRRNEV